MSSLPQGPYRFAKRTAWPTSPNPLAEALERARLEGRAVLDLTESNPTRCRFEYLKQASWLKDLSAAENLRYEPDAQGLRSAREAVCAYYASKGARVSEGQVFLTASTSESYSYLFRLLCDPGENVLVPAPSYPLFDYLAGLNDVRAERYRLLYDGRWRLDAAALDHAAGLKGPRAVLVVNPNNPTGHFTSEEERAHFDGVAARFGAAVISDEVFLDFAWREGARTGTFAGGGGALTFTLGGVSKMLGLPQMKLGWIVVSGPAELRDEARRRLEVISDTFLSANTPAQRALPGWMARRREAETEIARRLQKNLRSLEEALASSAGAAELLGGEGGWCAVLRLKTGEPDDEFALRLLRESAVHVHPGYFFDFEEDCLVVSLLPPEEDFTRGARLLARSL